MAGFCDEIFARRTDLKKSEIDFDSVPDANSEIFLILLNKWLFSAHH